MPDDPSIPGPGADGTPSSGDEPAILSRRQLQQRGRRTSRGWWYVIGIVAVIIIGVVIAVVATSASPTPTAANKPVATTTTTSVAPPTVTCPLTGLPAPGGVVPARPALGVKIGNYPGDRPSAGLNQADVVFEEPVEGAITRLVAVFQCQGAALVGDLRSAREPDAAILSQLSHPIFVHAGGINPVLALIASSPLTEENVLTGSGAVIIHPAGRVAPYSTFANTSALWALAPSDTAPPQPIFTYSNALPKGAVNGSGGTVHIPFSTSSDVTWTWNAATGEYLRSYAGEPDLLLDGSQTTTTNIVVMTVDATTGSWVENSEGGHEVDVAETGTGPVVVLRGGAAITGTWSRSNLTTPATYTAANGAPITLRPGSTWVELVPASVTVTATPIGTTPAEGSSGG